MAISRVADHLLMIAHRFVNCYLLEAEDGLTLVDTGFPGTEGLILQAIGQLGRAPADLKHVILTHAHPDHIGSAAAVKRATGATVLIHPADRAIAERGTGFRPLTPAPGLLFGILCRVFSQISQKVPPVPVDGTVAGGQSLPVAGGLEIIHVPGHCAGQVALLWRPSGILFTADSCTNLFGLGDPVGFEDRRQGRLSQARLGHLDFATACFGHGKPVLADAGARFRSKWPEP